MDVLRWTERPTPRNPILVCSFRGWNDAGESASAAVGLLIANLEARQVGEIDPEEFFDFTAVRPSIRLEDGMARVIDWPKTTVHVAEIAGAERDLVLVHGVEPSLRWRGFCGAVIEIAHALGVEMVISLGALLADIPHTRPTSITGFAADEALVERLGLSRSNYEGPTGVVGVLHGACAEAEMPSVSLWASVPHYVAAATPNPKAALALVRKVEGIAGVAVDASELEDATVDYERQVTAAVAGDADVRAFVEQLEEAVDEQEDDSPPPPRIPSGDTIAQDFQRFLRQQRHPDEE